MSEKCRRHSGAKDVVAMARNPHPPRGGKIRRGRQKSRPGGGAFDDLKWTFLLERTPSNGLGGSEIEGFVSTEEER